MSYGKQIQEYLQQHHPEMLAMLENLVNRNTNSEYKPGVDEAGLYIKETFEKIGFSVEVLERDNVGNSVVARKTGAGNGRVLLICHIDSVFPEGTDYIKPFTIDGNLATGNGVLDMKACIVGCYFALKALDDLQITRPDVVVFLSGDEEKGSEAVRVNIEEEGKLCNWTLVTEGSRPGMAVVTQRKGNAYLHVTAKGRAAHAGNEPTIGKNAIVDLAQKIAQLNGLNDFEKGTTISVTKFSGGENRIVIPDFAEMYVDIRFFTMEEWERVERAIREILTYANDGITIDYQLTLNRPPLSLVPGSTELIETVKAASAELGIPYSDVQPGGVSDGNFVSALGVPTIDGMGPSGGMMCSPEEYLEIDTMVPCAARLALTLAKLGG